MARAERWCPQLRGRAQVRGATDVPGVWYVASASGVCPKGAVWCIGSLTLLGLARRGVASVPGVGRQCRCMGRHGHMRSDVYAVSYCVIDVSFVLFGSVTAPFGVLAGVVTTTPRTL